MIHAAAPHFLWSFAVRHAAHQLNFCPRLSLPETSPTLRWMGEVGDASMFRFYHPTSRRVFPSQDVTFDKSVPFYCLFPYHSAPPPPPSPFLAPCPPAVDPLPPEGGAEPEGAQSEGAGSGGAEPGGAELGGAEPAGVEPGGPAGSSPRRSPQPEPLSLQQLCDWFSQRTRLRSAGVTVGACGTGGTAAAGPGGARTKGTEAAGTGSVGGVGAGGAAAGDRAELGGAGAGGTGAGGAGAGGAGAGDPGAVGAGAGGTGAGGAGAGGGGAGGAVCGGIGVGGTVRPRLYFVPLLQQVLGLPSSADLTPPLLVPCPRPPPVPGTHAMSLSPSSVPLRVPLPPPPGSSLPAIPDLESDLARATRPTVSRLLATVVTYPSFESIAASALVAELVEFAVACRLDYATTLIADSKSASPPTVGGECAFGTDVLEDKQEDLECLAAAVPRFASMLLAPEGDPDAPDIPIPRSYEEVITGPYSSQWQTAMDAEMASWKSTGTYVNAVPPYRANIVNGMRIFRVKQPPVVT
ncbi:unnamed protein product [Closterium sp. NIES-53]